MNRSLIRSAAAVGAAALAAVTLSACGGGESTSLLKNIESGKVTLGTKYDQPGLGLRNKDGSMSGLDVDIAQAVVKEIAEAKGWDAPTVEWRETPSAQRETLIQNGEVDMIAATYSINKGRAESVNFAGPYLLTHQGLLVREDAKEINGLNDLDGKILCSVSGSTPAQKVKDELPGVQLQEYDTYSSCVEALRQGNIDALTTDATILNGYAAQSPGQFRVIELKKADGSDFTDEYYGVGLAKDDKEGTDAINEALKKLQDNGTFDELVKKNLGAGEGVTKGNVGDLSFLEK
ncbi:glutamate ABC transporter substrate-binding protein [Corynebacterium spheniscorum]|uniref:L-glutamate-binding protein n=1 Tax=Corynebacterium spheniscorum TaxID=185761 RepID=A0A1I2R3M8_9CORY|nr:glutamate ABC transporter substrate-binding protein [Corynebacterium spheniscorum]KAA8722952.1 glutamate ABC transporter substrate-binding protein [Corynebacterium spheniscorum]SFG35010.1 L-glutamate-binding protein [Corynebacterium spheniscorum]